MSMPAHHVDVRRVHAADDLEPIADLFDRYRQFYGHPPARARCRDYIHARLEHAESVVFAATTPGAGTVGFVQLYPTFSSLALAPVWVLNDLYVDTRARRTGVANLLMQRAEAFAADRGAAAVTLETAAANHPAKALYTSRGYQLDIHHDHYTLPLDRPPGEPLETAVGAGQDG